MRPAGALVLVVFAAMLAGAEPYAVGGTLRPVVELDRRIVAIDHPATAAGLRDALERVLR